MDRVGTAVIATLMGSYSYSSAVEPEQKDVHYSFWCDLGLLAMAALSDGPAETEHPEVTFLQMTDYVLRNRVQLTGLEPYLEDSSLLTHLIKTQADDTPAQRAATMRSRASAGGSLRGGNADDDLGGAGPLEMGFLAGLTPGWRATDLIEPMRAMSELLHGASIVRACTVAAAVLANRLVRAPGMPASEALEESVLAAESVHAGFTQDMVDAGRDAPGSIGRWWELSDALLQFAPFDGLGKEALRSLIESAEEAGGVMAGIIGACRPEAIELGNDLLSGIHGRLGMTGHEVLQDLYDQELEFEGEHV
jgi:hypothetical protein